MYRVAPLRRTTDAALRDLAHQKSSVRRSAARDLGAGDPEPRVVEALLERLREDVDVEVRGAAALALADCGAAGVVDALVAAARAGPVRVSQMCLVAIGELAEAGDGETVDFVEGHLAHEAAALRFQAALSLGALAPARLLQAAPALCRDDDPSVRHLALRLCEAACEHGEEFQAPPDVVALAQSALGDPDRRVRLAGALLLGRLGDASGASELLDAVQARTGTHEPDDEAAAILQCGALGLRVATRALERRAYGWFLARRQPFAWQARAALARLGHARATREILTELGSSDDDVRALAVAAAGEARLAAAAPLLRDARGVDPDVIATALRRIDGATER